jgi:peptidoglycan-associated lipoprotein
MRKNILAAATLALLLAACAEEPPAPVENRPPPAPVTKQETPAAAPTTAPVAAPTAEDEYALSQLKNPRSILSKRSIYFDFDQFVVKDEFKPLIEAHAKMLVRNPGTKMLIQGNADERGSREYNLALGQKRAEAVKKLLIVLGAKETQIEAVSLGKEKPRCTESNEACWSQNRRDDMLYSGEF